MTAEATNLRVRHDEFGASRAFLAAALCRLSFRQPLRVAHEARDENANWTKQKSNKEGTNSAATFAACYGGSDATAYAANDKCCK